MIRVVSIMSIWAVCAPHAVAQECPDAIFPSRLFDPGIGYIEHVSAGDFNNDGMMDALASSDGASGIGVLLGQGDGAFAPGFRVISPNQGTSHCVVVDLNGDGLNDLASIGYDSGRVSISITGESGVPRYLMGEGPLQIIAADLDDDGDQDLVSAGWLSGTIGVWVNRGDGRPSMITQYDVGGGVRDVVAGDFDLDGDLDIAGLLTQQSEVVVLLAQDDGTYLEDARIAVGSLCYELVSGDFDANGTQDLAVANSGQGEVDIFTNAGMAQFSKTSTLDVGEGPRSIETADVNLDGAPDLVTLNIGSDDMSVLLNTGGGTFASEVRYPTLEQPIDFVLAEFDAIPGPDVFVASDDDVTSFISNMGDGRFNARQVYASNGSRPRSVAVGDFDSDGDLDAVCANDSGFAQDENLSIFLNQGDGRLVYLERFAAGDRLVDVQPIDVDGDGDLDLFALSLEDAVLTILQNDGAANFTPFDTIQLIDASPSGFVLSDFDGDGVQDLAVSYLSYSKLQLHMGLGGGVFAAPVEYDSGVGISGIDDADYDGDGDVDLALIRNDSMLLIYMNDGDGHMASPVPYTASRNMLAMVSADFDADGSIDIAAANSGAPAHGEVTGLLVFRNKGDGTFGPEELYENPIGADMKSIEAADFDADGDIDLVYQGGGYGVGLRLNDGAGNFDQVVRHDSGLDTPSSSTPLYMAHADMDGDGTVDLVVPNEETWEISVLLNLCDSAPGCLGDFTGDGELNFFDVSAYLMAYLNNDPAADFTYDGVFNFFDVSAFLIAFNAGCP
ncbi:MAG: FG-GAP-like repeat-containing protein [Phycisphaerales bacterium JB047]